jgi:hypothetical protein
MEFSPTNFIPHVGAMTALCMALFCAVPAQAGDVRIPEDKVPALVFAIPDDWSGAVENGTLNITNNRSSDAVVALVFEDPTVRDISLDEVHRGTITSGVHDSGRQDDVKVAGLEGKAYYETLTNNNGDVVDIKQILVKLDGTHAAMVTVLASQPLDPASRKTLDKIVESVRLISAR